MTNKNRGVLPNIKEENPQQRVFGTKLNRPRLYLTTIDDHFAPERDLAFGPHCFIG